MKFLLYVVFAMILYDFSVHVIYILGWEKFFLKRKVNYWPEWFGKKYQGFWAVYWGIALTMLLFYLLLNF